MLSKIYSYLYAFYKHLQNVYATGKPEEMTASTRRDRRKLNRQIKPKYFGEYGRPLFSNTLPKRLRR
jgi:hypothetical protein